MQQALAFDDADRLRVESHQLMGVLANLGATDAAAACGRVETDARAGDLAAAVASFTDARPAITTARAAAVRLRRAPVTR
ncbi:Hpt domain-containing protein [Actinoplanes couchii]|uniref:HPt domain-containing protein n=1 Tax=Actinoplanes couchii TaxID=403638 RepID=A0ABQ3X7F4_9ACTN|nr:Hpt domain-containing protein [Actinoplanes couchii]MDR6322284.1 HPt (histidine-containing phosphotransfer) domain-containing protein [Actinoplanes couchii]GID54443.1 hypothetical protein Aco03nite_028470 [Actinoplanes couchii]